MLQIRKKLAATWWKMPGDEPAPEFLLAPLNSAAWLDVRNHICEPPQGSIAGSMSITGAGAMTAVNESVRDWRNVFDEAGQPLEFRRALLAELPTELLLDLATEIAHRSILTERERKNSQSPSTAH